MDGPRFGSDLRLLRLGKRWRQVDLARAARVSRGVIARIEQGRGDRVTVATLDRVAASLGARVIVRLHWQGESQAGTGRCLHRSPGQVVRAARRRS